MLNWPVIYPVLSTEKAVDTKLDKEVLLLLLKSIWNEIFDNNFIVLLESALKDKINAVYRLLITCLDPKLWRSEILKIKWENGNKSSKNQ